MQPVCQTVLGLEWNVAFSMDKYTCIDHFRITAIWPGDRIRRPEHPTENEVRRCSCDESV